jgi:hypothetical protein
VTRRIWINLANGPGVKLSPSAAYGHRVLPGKKASERGQKGQKDQTPLIHSACTWSRAGSWSCVERPGGLSTHATRTRSRLTPFLSVTSSR